MFRNFQNCYDLAFWRKRSVKMRWPNYFSHIRSLQLRKRKPRNGQITIQKIVFSKKYIGRCKIFFRKVRRVAYDDWTILKCSFVVWGSAKNYLQAKRQHLIVVTKTDKMILLCSFSCQFFHFFLNFEVRSLFSILSVGST